MTISKDWCAWTAGILDGEGCIYVTRFRSGNKDYPTYALQVSVGNTDKAMVVKLATLWGGPSWQRKTNNSKITKTPKTVWVWTVSGRTAGRILEACMPWLVTKYDQAQVALDFVSTIGHGERGGVKAGVLEQREQCYLQLRALKK